MYRAPGRSAALICAVLLASHVALITLATGPHPCDRMPLASGHGAAELSSSPRSGEDRDSQESGLSCRLCSWNRSGWRLSPVATHLPAPPPTTNIEPLGTDEGGTPPPSGSVRLRAPPVA